MKLSELDREDLVDDLWGATIPAWLGLSLATFAPLSVFFSYLAIDRVPWLMALFAAICMVGGLALSVPYWRIYGELQRRHKEYRTWKYGERG